MKDSKKERFPACVPLHYRIFTQLRKVYRQSTVRLIEKKARTRTPKENGLVSDGKGVWADFEKSNVPNLREKINRSSVWIDEDMQDPSIRSWVDGIERVKKTLHDRNLAYTNTAATFLKRLFLPRSERDKLWECAWTLHHSGIKPHHRALDVGGASTPFSFFLASMGCDVDVIDNDWGNCGTLYNANHVAQAMQWKLRAHDRDIEKPFPFSDATFDRVYSICVIEHLTSHTRRHMMKEMGRVLKPGGILGLTMGYSHDYEHPLVDKGLRFGYRQKLEADLLEPSGLELYGNQDLLDFRDEKNFLGAIFLKKALD